MRIFQEYSERFEDGRLVSFENFAKLSLEQGLFTVKAQSVFLRAHNLEESFNKVRRHMLQLLQIFEARIKRCNAFNERWKSILDNFEYRCNLAPSEGHTIRCTPQL